MNSITFGALPFSIPESQNVIDVSATIASLAGRKKPIKFANRATVPFAFVLEHVHKLIPSGVRDRFGKTVIPDHVSNSQVFNMYRLVIADKFFACLMKKITALIRNFLMLNSKSMSRVTSGIRTFLFPGYRALKSFETFLKPGKFGSIVKEAAVGNIKMPETLLQGLGVYFSEPAIFFLLLELGEHSRCIMVVQPLLLVVLMFCIPINALAQKVVVDKASTTKVFLKKGFLCSIGIYSVFVCFINFHITNHTMCFVICQGGIHLPAEAGSFLPSSL